MRSPILQPQPCVAAGVYFCEIFGSVVKNDYLCSMSNEGYSGAKNEKHPSMKRRMEGQDYTGRGIYMVTLAVEGRQPLLGRLAGRADAPAGSSEAPHVELTALGKRVNGEVEHISSYYPQVRVLGKQVMPDHVHFILFVTEQMDVPLGRVVNGFKTGCRRALRELLSTPQISAPQISAPQSGTARNTVQAKYSCFSNSFQVSVPVPGLRRPPSAHARRGLCRFGHRDAVCRV